MSMQTLDASRAHQWYAECIARYSIEEGTYTMNIRQLLSRKKTLTRLSRTCG